MPRHHSGDERGVDVAERFGVAFDHEIVEFRHVLLVRFWVLCVVWPAYYSC